VGRDFEQLEKESESPRRRRSECRHSQIQGININEGRKDPPIRTIGRQKVSVDGIQAHGMGVMGNGPKKAKPGGPGENKVGENNLRAKKIVELGDSDGTRLPPPLAV